jgi:hypothetical protein
VNSGMPAGFWIAMNGHPEIASADPLLHDLFKLGRCLLLLIHAASPLMTTVLWPGGLGNVNALKVEFSSSMLHRLQA